MYEEDHVVSLDAIEFLETNLTSNSVPQHVAAYSHYGHIGRSSLARVTAFPAQWGIAINRPMLDALWHAHHSRVIRESVISNQISQIPGLSDGDKEKRVLQWTRRFQDAFEMGHGDGVLQYAMWESNAVSIAPWNSLIKDIGHLSPGGYSKRPQNGIRSRGIHPVLPAIHSRQRDTETGFYYCDRCERQNSL
jgi:hypothetical protein